MTIVKRQMALHNTVSVIGGFFGGYTVVNHCDIIANAQTGNLMRLVVQACRGNLDSIGFIILAFLIYAAANVFYAVARRYMRISMKIVSFIVTAAVIVLTGLLTGADNDYLAILPVFFFAPVQWNAFKKAGGNSSATIFSSNNVRQAVLLLTKYFMDKDKKALKNSRFYWVTLLCFYGGAAMSTLLSMAFGANSVWFCFLPLGVSVFAYVRYRLAKLKAFGQ